MVPVKLRVEFAKLKKTPYDIYQYIIFKTMIILKREIPEAVSIQASRVSSAEVEYCGRVAAIVPCPCGRADSSTMAGGNEKH